MSKSHSVLQHSFLELIRRLEKADYFDKTSLDKATTAAKGSDGTGLDKLLIRADILDEDGEIWQALMRANATLLGLEKVSMIGYFVLGLVGGFGLLASQKVNFFYLLIALLGWHSVSLLIWCIRSKNQPSGLLGLMVDKFWQKQIAHGDLDGYAYEVLYHSQKSGLAWRLAKLIHKNWLCGLFGNSLALLVLFLFKNYQFFWESTILPHAIFVKLIHAIGFLPSVLGFDLSQINAHTLAWLVLVSIGLYAILPRSLAYLYGWLKWRNIHFEIDTNLYYYENLLYKFNQLVIDQDDYTAPMPKPAQAVVSSDKKTVATLERPCNEPFWFQFGAGANVLDIGVMDTADDFERLRRTVEVTESQVYLGIDKAILPDRGVLRKLEKITTLARFGLVVELIGTGEHGTLWQAELVARNISEIRYK